jgi:ABC-type cobalamin transport system permease subunit
LLRWTADTLGERGIKFLTSWDGKMTRGDKLALVGVTVGWLLAGGLMTWAIYAFMVHVLKYW